MKSWNEAIEKVIEQLKKEHIEFNEVQGKLYIASKIIRNPIILYKPLEIQVKSEKNYICKFEKIKHNTDKTETIKKEFSYLVPVIRYIKKYVKGEL